MREICIFINNLFELDLDKTDRFFSLLVFIQGYDRINQHENYLFPLYISFKYLFFTQILIIWCFLHIFFNLNCVFISKYFSFNMKFYFLSYKLLNDSMCIN